MYIVGGAVCGSQIPLPPPPPFFFFNYHMYVLVSYFLCSVSSSTRNVSILGVVFLLRVCRYIFDFLQTAGLTSSTYLMFLEQCSKAISFLTTDSHSVHRNGNTLQKFVDATKVNKIIKLVYISCIVVIAGLCKNYVGSGIQNLVYSNKISKKERFHGILILVLRPHDIIKSK